MLEIIWFLGLTVAAIICVIGGERNIRSTQNASIGLPGVAILLLLVSFAISFEATLKAPYFWLTENLPQSGTFINQFTSGALVAIGAFVWVIGVPLGTQILYEKFAD